MQAKAGEGAEDSVVSYKDGDIKLLGETLDLWEPLFEHEERPGPVAGSDRTLNHLR